MRGDQRNRGFGAEIDVGLVDHHGHVRMLSSRVAISARDSATPVGAFGLGDDDRAGRPAIIGDADPHGLIERHGLVGDAEQAAIDRIEAVGDVGEQQRRIMLEQRGEGVRQHLVRAVADEHLFGPHPW